MRLTKDVGQSVYPPDWPRCACGDYALHGLLTCGRLECVLHVRRLAGGFAPQPPDSQRVRAWLVFQPPKWPLYVIAGAIAAAITWAVLWFFAL